MKKLLLIAVIITSHVYAQIPNAGFETWVNSTGSPHTYQEPQGWTSTDPLWNLINASYTVASVVQTSQSHSGSSAALLQTAAGGGDTVGGVLLSTASIATLFGSGMPGFSCTTRPANLQAYYKFAPVGGDLAGFITFLTKWNSGTNRRDTLGTGFFLSGTPVASYSLVSIPITYSINVFPDTATIEVMLYGGGSTPHMGSQFFVDDLGFTGSAPFGIEGFEQAEELKMYPNPSNGLLHIEATEEISEVQIANALGETVRHERLKSSSVQIDVNALPPGVYTVRVCGITRKLIKE